MKSLFTLSLLIALLVSVNLYSQVPKLLNYQAVARNSTGAVMSNTSVSVEFKIHDLSLSGTVVFDEQYTGIQTNQFGLFTIAIGDNNGTINIGSIGAVNWANGSKFLEVDLNGVPMGTTQLISVPYALYADTAAVANTANYVTNSTANVQVFNTSGTFTWTKPSGVSMVQIVCVGGGGGGAGSGTDASTFGASGGGGGAYNMKLIGASVLGATVSVTVGGGGAGGIAGVSYNLGGAGNTGGVSSFGNILIANGGIGGASGTNPAGGLGGVSEYPGGNGGNGGAYPGGNGVSSTNGGGGGGCGGNQNANGGNGGTCGYSGIGGTGGSPQNGTNGGNGADYTALSESGGAGGGGAYGAIGLMSGNGGLGGGGGGGGGMGGNNGGNGGNGVVIVYSW